MPASSGTAYEVRGSGPAVVLPQCNVDWAAYPLRPLVERQRDPQVWAKTLDALDCPVWSWWGGADPLFDEPGGIPAHRAVVEARGLPHRELPGLDHGEALAAIEEVLPEVADWLEPLLAA